MVIINSCLLLQIFWFCQHFISSSKIDKCVFLLGLVFRVDPNFIGVLVSTLAVPVPMFLEEDDNVTNLELNLTFTLGFMLQNHSLEAKEI